MRRIALMNQKGGVGKTTTSVNLAAALARHGRKVLLLDIDPQAHSTTHLGVETQPERVSLYDVLVRSRDLADGLVEVEENLTILPSSLDLAAAEVELAGIVGREQLVRDLLEDDGTAWDYVLMDCPPSLGVLTLNALTAATEVLVPLQPHFLSLHGLSKLFETVQVVARRLNPGLVISGIALCLYESGTRLSAEVMTDLDSFLDNARSSQRDTPWKNAVLHRTRVRRNIRLAEASSFGKTIFDYDASSNGAKDYHALMQEIVAQEPALERTDAEEATDTAA